MIQVREISNLGTDLDEVSGAHIDKDFVGIVEGAVNVERRRERDKHLLSYRNRRKGEINTIRTHTFRRRERERRQETLGTEG